MVTADAAYLVECGRHDRTNGHLQCTELAAIELDENAGDGRNDDNRVRLKKGI
jgi:hypothetical protein